MGKVYLALVWHHHQPCYREGPGGRLAMPWVRLHGIKDYYGMAWLAQEHPEVHLTFNLVPSLLSQLESYAQGTAEEEWLRLTAKPAADLEGEEAEFLLNEFFRANWETMVRPHARYHELLLKRRFARRSAAQAAGEFSRADLRDLQVWATLAWFFPQLLRDDPVLRELVAKGRGYSEEDKAAMLARQREVLAAIIPMYRGLQERGTAELSVSPFYHPILPLLCKMERAREGLPKVALPRGEMDFGDDARVQLARGVEAYGRLFGRAPRGMWPPEGSVSPEVPVLAAEAGLHWLATDEGILCRSLGRGLHHDSKGCVVEWETLYQAYRAPAGGGDIAMLFRDRRLSDLIGFQYYHRAAEDAANDFAGQLGAIAAAAEGRNPLVTVILDGENAWEYYQDSGMPFLHALYRRLGGLGNVEALTVSECLERSPARAVLPRVFSGSWINADFGVWVGHAEDRRAWELLARARAAVAAKVAAGGDVPGLADAWEEIYIAEGSDWFWWYGDDRSSPQDAEFDRLFRQHLKNAYRLVGERPPIVLDEPIAQPHPPPATRPTGFISPAVNGSRGSFFDWSGAGVYRRGRDGGTMEKGSPDLIQAVYFGFNARELFFRLDFNGLTPGELPPETSVAIVFTAPRDVHLEVTGLWGPRPAVRVGDAESGAARAAAGEVLEIACPFEELGLHPRDAVRFHVSLLESERLLERAPHAGSLALEVPEPDFERQMWQV